MSGHDKWYAVLDLGSITQLTTSQYPQWTGRRDRRGIPVYLFEVKHLTNKNVSQFSQEVSEQGASETHKDSAIPARLLCLFSLYENLLQFVHPLCSALARPNPETPIVSSNNIVDISGVSLMQFWNLRSHMQDASVLSTAHYPETLDRIFVRPPFSLNLTFLVKRKNQQKDCRSSEPPPSSQQSGTG